ncbi:alpha/beta fold hydrolase [Halocalculus aciditolerans]|uniref:Alpha/beta hydrolase n=1 Tax=Halocalculus aciditolerans TaxID=1383812 RepID=A0A830F8V1_9EURY|nr:alpha/beta hydrolase [Halocalculus aciditolerans]GGL66034.1 alpha/beta hydrolase [Halocalculus aciditolerans]
MTELTGHYTTVSGTRTYYESVGDASDPTLIAIHTAGADGRQWRHVAPLLKEEGYRVIVPDLPGHGKSYPVDWEPHDSIHRHAEFVFDFMSKLALDNPAVTGCSIGGDIVLDLAVNHPESFRAALAFEGAGRTRGAQLGRLSHPHALPGWQSVLEYSVTDSTADSVPEEARRELVWQHRSAHEVGTNDLQGWADHDVTDRLSEATLPVLLVRGSEDFYIQDDVFQETIDGLPDCTPVTMDETGHYPMMEHPSRTTTLIRDFLTD